ncbi:MFS transporter [Isoptericola sp. NPDC060282]|uniref:MFS transporter n=1 Tax=Isoptericola sp. NPDC060282 TaxID=3347093 RepID=UPI0036654966
MRSWSALLAICLGTFLLLLDATIVTVALPDMHDDLGASFTDLQWLMDAYALMLATSLLGAGALADRTGRRRVYVAGLAIFMGASVLCALAPDVQVLIAARALQGVGGAAMLATTLALLSVTYHGRQRGIAFGVWGAVSGATTALGLLLGGVLTEVAGWPWIFAINVPVGILAILVSLRALPSAAGDGRRKLDLAGTATFTIAAGALVLAIIRGQQDGWTSPRILLALAAAAAATILFVVIESRVAQPVLDLALFRRPPFVAAMVATLTLQAAAFSTLPSTSVWLQTVEGLGPVDTGVAFLPLAVPALVVAGFSGRLLHRVPPRITIGTGLLVVAGGAVTLALCMKADSAASALTTGLVVVGTGAGLAIVPVADAAMAAVPHDRAGMASGAMNTFRQLGFALGIALFGAVLQARLSASLLDQQVPQAPALGAAVSSGGLDGAVAQIPPDQVTAITHAVREAFAVGLSGVYLTAAVVALVGATTAFALGRRTTVVQELGPDPVELG